MSLQSHQLINQTSGEVEIYTPPDILDLVRTVFGGTIDLDPASCEDANRHVGARAFYGESAYDVVGQAADGLPIRRYENWGGLSQTWEGKVWMNPPFGQPDSACKVGCTKKRCVKRGWHTATALPGMVDWVDRLVFSYRDGGVTEALCITFAATSEGWFQPLLVYPQCFPRKRTNYRLPDGSVYQGVTKGSCITYLGANVDRFAEVFSDLGTVKIAYPLV